MLQLFNLDNNTNNYCYFYIVYGYLQHLQPYLPDKTDIPYRLCTRSHNMTLINKMKFLTDADFLIRMLYKYSY